MIAGQARKDATKLLTQSSFDKIMAIQNKKGSNGRLQDRKTTIYPHLANA